MNRLPRRLIIGLAITPAIGLVIFYLWPFASLLLEAVGWDATTTVLRRRRTWEIVWFTTWQAVASTALTMLIGLAPAWAIARFDFPGRRTLVSILTAAFVMPTVVMGAAMLAVLPDSLARTVWRYWGPTCCST